MVSISNTFLKYPENARENVRKMYNLDQPGRLEEALTIIEEWIKKQDHFLKKDFCRGFLECELYICKGLIEKMKIQLDRHCTMKTLLPKFFMKHDLSPMVQELKERGAATVLPQMTKDFHRVLLFKINGTEFKADTWMKFYELNVFMTEYVYRRDCYSGIVLMYDCRETNYLDLIRNFNMTEFQQFISLYLTGYKTTLVGIHMLIQSKGVDILVKVIKSLLKPKMASRLNVLLTVEELYEKVPKEILPADYGGCEKPLDQLTDEWLAEICTPDHQEYMKSMNKARSDESRRQNSKFNEEYLGMSGSFRKMILD